MHQPRIPAKASRYGIAIAGAAALLATTLVSSNMAASGAPEERTLDALQTAPDKLQTPFEQSDGATWTTWPQSRDFWNELDASSDRVRVDRIGNTVQGRPMQLVQVGLPAPKSVDEAADGSVLMYNCSIHGDEPSGREACMQLARDLSTTTDPTWERLLKNTTVLLLNANPDGWVADTRENTDGIDINRDMMDLASPEANTIARTIRDWKPDVLNDLHEYGSNPYYRTDLLHLWPRNRQADQRIYQLAKTMNNDYSAAQVEGIGYTAGIYGEYVKDGEPFLQVAGDDQARILRNYSGLEHVVGMLSETANDPLTPEEEADESLLNRRRVEVNYTSAVGSAQFIGENRTTVERQTAAAAERATTDGADQAGLVYFAGQDNRLPTDESEVEPEPMCGYQLTAEQLTALRTNLRTHGITWERNADGAFVSMAQPDQPLIPLLLDKRSEYGITDATPVADC